MIDVKFDEYGEKLVNDSSDIVFDCPACSKGRIARSAKAKEMGKAYTCPSCRFVGP